jgi:hypothetical protein
MTKTWCKNREQEQKSDKHDALLSSRTAKLKDRNGGFPQL